MYSTFRLLIEVVATLAILSAVVGAEEPFPTATPQQCGISADALALLSGTVEEFVAREAVVGAELHVIKDRKTVFHQAYGWADIKDQRRLETGTTYCVRSMTKPLTGTAIQMLIDEDKLTLDQRVATILTEFDQPQLDTITIQHLLTHTSGLPLTAIRGALSEYKTIRGIAADAAEAGLDFAPGTRFQYSDAGSDTLGAIIAEVTGSPPEEFIAHRILKPLQMHGALVDIGLDASRRNIPSAYSGGTGNWQRHWHSSAAPIYPLFLTSQSLYCTTTDYARFMTLWMDGGKSRQSGEVLLSADAIRRAFGNGSPMKGYPNGFEQLQLTYGQQWMVYRGADDSQIELFAHSGSDGTHAWAWPQRDLIILFFTQSRGTMAGVELEPVIDRLLIRGEVESYRKELAAQEALERSWGPFEGIYWDETSESDYYVFSIENQQLTLERPGRVRAVLKAGKEPGEFSMIGLKIKFESSDEGSNGAAPAVVMSSAGGAERQVRHQPDESLPKLDAVIQRVREAHGIDHLKDSGVVKLTGTMKIGLFGRKGQLRQWFDQDRSRTEIEIGSSKTIVITRDDAVYVSTAGGPFQLLEGAAGQQELLGHPAIHYGGWKKANQGLQVLKQMDWQDQSFLLVRTKTLGLPGTTLLIDAKTGLINRVKQLQFVPGAGFVGLQSRYSDFREVNGMTLPFLLQTKSSSPLIGKATIQFESHEFNVAPEGLFDITAEE